MPPCSRNPELCKCGFPGPSSCPSGARRLFNRLVVHVSNSLAGNVDFAAARFRRIGRISFSRRRRSASRQLQSLADRMAPSHGVTTDSAGILITGSWLQWSVDCRAVVCTADSEKNRLGIPSRTRPRSRSSWWRTARRPAESTRATIEGRRSGNLFLQGKRFFFAKAIISRSSK